jgi:queuine tRNA-ribosyltransferase
VFISNAYLIYLRPGLDILKKAGGYHKFINWNKPIFTDSGGFQLKDPEFFISLDKKGVWFKNPFSKEKVFLSPENVVEIQNAIGSDIAMILDDMIDANKPKQEYKEAVDITIDWAKRAVVAHKNKNQLLFCIVQGGVYKDLRGKCAKELNELPFDGVGIGGLALGESKDKMYKAIDYSLVHLSENKIKYLMGVGSPEDVVKCIGKGIDCFDSVYPTKMGRHGIIFTREGKIDLKRGIYKTDFSKPDKDCDCYTCRNHTLAYLHHLYKLNEPNSRILNSMHNIRFMQKLVEDARKAIIKGEFKRFQDSFLKDFLKNKK